MFSVVSLLGIIYSFWRILKLYVLSAVLPRLLSSSPRLAGNTFTGLTAQIPEAQNKAEQTQGIKSSLHFPKCQLKKNPTAEIKVIESIKNREIVQKQNPCLLPKSTILKLIQIKNVSGDKAAPVVWKPLSCIKSGSILGPVGPLLSIGLKQRSQHAEATLNPRVFCSSAHNS